MISTEGQANGPYIECKDLFKIYKRAELEVVALRGWTWRSPRAS